MASHAAIFPALPERDNARTSSPIPSPATTDDTSSITMASERVGRQSAAAGDDDEFLDGRLVVVLLTDGDLQRFRAVVG